MYKDMDLEEYTGKLAEGTSIPGGGGACALAGAVGTALGNMVGSMTVGRLKYYEVEDEMQELVEQAEKLEKEFLALIDEDAECFKPMAEAYKMPADNPIDKAKKVAVMEAAMSHACIAPMKVMHRCCDAIELLEKFLEKGNKSVESDAAVGALLCKAALRGASLNIFCNTKYMNDVEYASKLSREAHEMLDTYSDRAEAIFEKVNGKMQRK